MLFPQLKTIVRQLPVSLKAIVKPKRKSNPITDKIRLIKLLSLMWKHREPFGTVMPLPVCAQGAGVSVTACGPTCSTPGGDLRCDLLDRVSDPCTPVEPILVPPVCPYEDERQKWNCSTDGGLGV